MKFNFFKKNTEIENLKKNFENLSNDLNTLKREFNTFKLSEKKIESLENNITENKNNIQNMIRFNQEIDNNCIKLTNDIHQLEKDILTYHKNKQIEESINRECNVS